MYRSFKSLNINMQQKEKKYFELNTCGAAVLSIYSSYCNQFV